MPVPVPLPGYYLRLNFFVGGCFDGRFETALIEPIPRFGLIRQLCTQPDPDSDLHYKILETEYSLFDRVYTHSEREKTIVYVYLANELVGKNPRPLLLATLEYLATLPPEAFKP